MSEHVLNQYKDELKTMDRQAKYMVIFTSAFIHLFMNVYIQYFGTPYLKILVATVSVLTIVIMIVSGKYFDSHKS